MKPPYNILRRLGGLILVGLIFTFFVFAAMNPTNVCQTRPDHPDVRLRSRCLSQPLPLVAATISDVIPTIRTYGRRWQLSTSASQDMNSSQKNTLEYHVTRAYVPVIVFTDDLTVTLSVEHNKTRLDIRSASRIGRGDFGENRRHILQLLTKLDKNLKIR